MNRKFQTFRRKANIRNGRLILLILAAFSFAFFTACRELPVSEQDKTIFLRPSDLEEEGFKVAGFEAKEEISKSKSFDGAVDLEYNYEATDDPANVLVIQQFLTVEPKRSDALVSESIVRNAILLGLKAYSVEAEEVKDFYSLGESSSFYVLKGKSGSPVGHYFSMRDGRNVIQFTIVGMYFTDTEYWKEKVEPKLKAMAQYQP
jgi:hypothetical protein